MWKEWRQPLSEIRTKTYALKIEASKSQGLPHCSLKCCKNGIKLHNPEPEQVIHTYKANPVDIVFLFVQL